MRQLQDDSVMRVIATVKTAKSNEFQKLVSTGGATVGRGTEGSARSETNTPKIERVTIKLNPIYAYPKTTQEIPDFSEVDILGWLSSKLPTRSPAPKRMILLMATVTASRKASWLTPVRRPVTKPALLAPLKNSSGKWNRHYSGRTDRHSLQAESEIPQKCRLGDELGHGRDTTEAEK